MALPLLRSRLRLALVAAALLLAAAGVFRALRGPEVGAWQAARGTLVERVVASGQVLPPARVTLAALQLAQLQEVRVREGDRVARGQLLVQLDAAEADAQVAAARAQEAQARARLAQVRGTGARVAAEALRQAEVRAQQAEERLRRAEALAAGGSTSDQELSDAGRALELARSQAAAAEAQALAAGDAGAELQLAVAGLSQARAQLLLAEARLSQTRLRAPADGVVLLRTCEPGDVVLAGKPLLVLSSDGETRLSVQPDEKSLPLLRVGQPARAAADAFPGEPFDAEVLSVAPSVDPARGTVEVRLRVARPPAFLRPDMTVSVNVEVSRREGVLRIPAEAVRGQAGDAWALVIAAGRVERRPLQVGLRGQGAVEVLGGLSEGEWVAPPGARLSPGARARPVALPEPDRAL